MTLSNFKTISPQIPDEVDVVQALAMNKQGAMLLDVRELNEYTQIHTPNAILIPLRQLKERLNEIALNKDQTIAIICRSGVRSAAAVRMLQEEGFSQVCNVRGGILAWERAELEVVRK